MVEYYLGGVDRTRVWFNRILEDMVRGTVGERE
jgi:hypothetical protein